MQKMKNIDSVFHATLSTENKIVFTITIKSLTY